MLATAAPDLPPDDPAWGYELKWDGVRAIVFARRQGVAVQARSLRDITSRYPELAGLAGALEGKEAVFDGEVVALGPDGKPSFQTLQRRMHVASPPASLMASTPVALVAFDLLELDGEVLTDRPYRERRERLGTLGLGGPHWQVPPWRPGEGAVMRSTSREQGLEGVVAKRLDGLYEPGRRSRSWLKVKNYRRQELVVGGWAEGMGNREGRIGALLVGYHEGDDLRYAGNVGTGFTDQLLDDLAAALAPLERPASPFSNPPGGRRAHWVEPVLVAEVEFSDWTDTGTLRQPSFKGLRDDKDARDVVRE